MTLSSQLGAQVRHKSSLQLSTAAPAAPAEDSSLAGSPPPAEADPQHQEQDEGEEVDGGVGPRKKSIRKKLSSLLRSTGDLHALLDAGLVRTFSLRRRRQKQKLSSQWTCYTGSSLDEEGLEAPRTASTLSLKEAALLERLEVPLRRTLSLMGPRSLGAAAGGGGVAAPSAAGDAGPPYVQLRRRSYDHVADVSEFRRSMGSIPVEYSAWKPRYSRGSRWSSSLSSLQEGVIADGRRTSGSEAGSLGTLHGSEDSLFQRGAAPDEVDCMVTCRASSPTDSSGTTLFTGFHGPTWAFLYGANASGSLPSNLHQPDHQATSTGATSERPGLARSLSSTGDKRREEVARGCRVPVHLHEEPTRSRSLTHIAALDMSGDAGRPDRLVVPPESSCHSLRRQKLTSRSQLSSSEYFIVTFEVSSGDGAPEAPQPDEEYVVAAKGTTLEEALSGPCQKRGITLSNVSVFLEGCKVDLSATYLHTESSLLAGKQLRIRAKQDGKVVKGVLSRAATSQQPTLRKSSGSVRNNRRFFSTSTEEPGFGTPSAPLQPASDFLSLETFSKTKASKQRWSGFFGNNKDTKIGALTEQLDNYNKHGIPKEHLTSPEPDADEELYHLENWRELVEGSENLTERLQHQQDAIWELLHTELAYIRTLTVVKDLFLACLSSLQEARILTDVDKALLFSNIVDIHAANAHFWKLYLAPLVVATRGTRQPLNPTHLLDGFQKFEDIFRPYVQYCVEQAECQKYCRDRTAEGELFTVYLAWCETQSACNRLRLVDILVQPMQRLTKYSLLLKAIRKKTDCEEQRIALEVMIRKVDDFVNSVNSKLREREDHDRLRAIIARIDTYDVVESKDEDLEKLVRLHSDLDLSSPMPGCPLSQRRHLLLEGDLRLRDLNNSKVDVHCFLLTDMLLVCKSSTKKRLRVLRPPYLVERLVVQELPRETPTLACVYLNEYRVVTTAFLLTSQEPKLIKSWADTVRQARKLYAAAKHAARQHAPPLSLSRQPSSLYDEDLVATEDHEADTHYSHGLYPQRSPRGSTRGSSLNHSHSGSVEMNEASSVSSVSHSRGISVENNELRASSLSSDEGIPPLGADQAGAAGAAGGGRGLRRAAHSKSPSPNTLSIQVPVFSSLGQSLPNLNLAASSPHSGAQPPSSLLLVPSGPSGLHQHHSALSPGHRGTSYPPPSPPRGSLHRGLALVTSRNPPLMKMRHVSCSQQSCSGPSGPPPGGGGTAPGAALGAAPAAVATGTAATQTGGGGQPSPSTSGKDLDMPVIGGVSPPRDEGAGAAAAGDGAGGGSGGGPPPSPTGPRQAFIMKRLTRADNRRHHTAGAIDDVKRADVRDPSIQKRFSWNYGPQSCGKRQGGSDETHQDVLLIDRATSPLGPAPPHHAAADAAWSRVHSGSTERNPFAEPVVFQSPSVGSSPSVSRGHSGSSQLPSLNSSPTLAPSNPFLEDVAGQDESPAPDEVRVLINDAHSDCTDA